MNSKLTRDQLRERAQLKAKNLTYAISQSAFAGVRSELEEELQFLQCALACLEGENSEPVAWTDEQELRDVDRGGCGYLFTVNPVTPHADERRIILLYRRPQPAPVVLVVTDEMTPEQAHEIGDFYGDPVDVFARGANWMRQHIIDSTLAVSSQEVK